MRIRYDTQKNISLMDNAQTWHEIWKHDGDRGRSKAKLGGDNGPESRLAPKTCFITSNDKDMTGALIVAYPAVSGTLAAWENHNRVNWKCRILERTRWRSIQVVQQYTSTRDLQSPYNYTSRGLKTLETILITMGNDNTTSIWYEYDMSALICVARWDYKRPERNRTVRVRIWQGSRLERLDNAIISLAEDRRTPRVYDIETSSVQMAFALCGYRSSSTNFCCYARRNKLCYFLGLSQLRNNPWTWNVRAANRKTKPRRKYHAGARVIEWWFKETATRREWRHRLLRA